MTKKKKHRTLSIEWNGIDPSEISFKTLAGWGQSESLTKDWAEAYLASLPDEQYELALKSLNWKIQRLSQGPNKWEKFINSVWFPLLAIWILYFLYGLWITASTLLASDCHSECGWGLYIAIYVIGPYAIRASLVYIALLSIWFILKRIGLAKSR